MMNLDEHSFSKQDPSFIPTWLTQTGKNAHVNTYMYTKYRWSLHNFPLTKQRKQINKIEKMHADTKNC